MAHTYELLERTRKGAPLLKANTAIMELMIGMMRAINEIERKEYRLFKEWFIAQDDKEIAFCVEMASYHMEIATDIIWKKKSI